MTPNRFSRWRDALLLAILALLPWQARWIFSESPLGGMPWEQGTVSVFVLEPLLLAAAACHFAAREKPIRPGAWLAFGGAFAAWAGISAAWSPHPSAAILAACRLAEGLILAWMIARSSLPLARLAGAFLIGASASAALGLWQFFTQTSFASTVLGIAAHSPSQAGIAVIETASGRFLRAYGLAPHPNVFGGTMAAALIVGFLVAANVSGAARRWTTVSIMLVSGALIVSFSRSAWIGAAAAAALLFLVHRQKETRRRVLHAGLTALAGTVIALIAAWPLVTARLTASGRLEARSLSERSVSMREGLQAFLDAPVIGSGFASSGPLPPHLVPLLAASELGIIGALLLAAAFCAWLLAARKTPWLCAAVPICIAGVFDHYPLSLFAGVFLSAAAFGLSLRAASETR